MTEEQKKLLLIDLSGRLPYGVYGNYLNSDGSLSDDELLRRVKIGYHQLICADGRDGMVLDGSLKPYLFPLSSMTEEQIEKLKEELCNMYDPYHDYDSYENWGVEVFEKHIHSDNYKFTFTVDVVDWLNKNHFDYRGLIEKSLALDATNLGIYE